MSYLLTLSQKPVIWVLGQWLEKITSFTPQNPVILAPETWWDEILACFIPGSKVHLFP
jgi:hypothetical protein